MQTVALPLSPDEFHTSLSVVTNGELGKLPLTPKNNYSSLLALPHVPKQW